ncbi:MAG: ribosome silencing factor [Bacteroidales bacterium]|nr:ribosome silencing factor [Bacteroidales bacterium]MBN2763979.1 ribosome silencing factor [Bacteroidales bacterium]
MGNNNELLNCITDAILDKKGKEVVKIDLIKLGYAMCDSFILCHGGSTTQVHAIADAVEKKVKELTGTNVKHREGTENARWILLDYGSVVVHVFIKEARDYYKLEELWGDADLTIIKEE